MEKKNSGASIVMKILVTLGAIALIVGIFLPSVKLGFDEIKWSDELSEYAELFGGEDLDEMNAEFKDFIKSADDEDFEEEKEEFGFDLRKLEEKFSYISDFKTVDKAFKTNLSTFKLIVMIAAIVLALVTVICAWLNVSIVSIFTGLLSGGASVGFLVYLLISDFKINILDMIYGDLSELSLLGVDTDALALNMVYKFKINFAFFILAAGAVIMIISAIVLTIVNSKAKKAAKTSAAAASVPVNNNFADSQSDFGMDEQATVAMMDIPMQQPQNNSVGNQNNVNTGVLILDGDMKGVKIPIEANSSLTVGKDPQMASLVMDKKFLSVSRLHCTINYSAQTNQYYVTDNSSNGTFTSDGTRLVKGQKMSLPRQTIIYLATDKCKIKLL